MYAVFSGFFLGLTSLALPFALAYILYSRFFVDARVFRAGFSYFIFGFVVTVWSSFFVFTDYSMFQAFTLALFMECLRYFGLWRLRDRSFHVAVGFGVGWGAFQVFAMGLSFLIMSNMLWAGVNPGFEGHLGFGGFLLGLNGFIGHLGYFILELIWTWSVFLSVKSGEIRFFYLSIFSRGLVDYVGGHVLPASDYSIVAFIWFMALTCYLIVKSGS
jgi:hypothetical protein